MKENILPAGLAEKLRGAMGRYGLAWLILLAGVLLLLLPGEGEGAGPAEPETGAGIFDLTALETRLAEALSRIRGAGEVTVVLTLENGPRQVLAQDTDREEEGGQRMETVVLSRGSSSQETVTVQEISPRFQGALLVCPGGDDPEVRLKLTEATSALTGLGADKISISKGK